MAVQGKKFSAAQSLPWTFKKCPSYLLYSNYLSRHFPDSLPGKLPWIVFQTSGLLHLRQAPTPPRGQISILLSVPKTLPFLHSCFHVAFHRR